MVKNPPAMRDATGDAGSIPGSGGGPAGGHGNPLQYSCLASHGLRSLVGYGPHGAKESDVTEHAHTQGQEEPGFPDSQPVVLSSPVHGLSCHLEFLFLLCLSLTPFEFCPNSWAPVYRNSASTPSL